MTSFLETFEMVLRKLEDEKIPYMMVGSLASMVYGEPRLTRDMDLVVDVQAEHASKFEKLFRQPEFYCPPVEILSDEILNRRQFNLLHVPSGLKVDLMVLKPTAYDQNRFARRLQTTIWEGFVAYLATPEDIIIKKLEFFREGGSEKHIRDIRGIIANTELDQKYISKWVRELRLEPEWEKAQGK